MSWTTPATRATGDLITAAIWNNEHVGDLAYLHGDAGTINLNNTLAVSGIIEAIVAAAGATAFEGFVSGEANPRILIDTFNGATIRLGPGGGTALDTILYRNAAAQLRTSGSLILDSFLQAANLFLGYGTYSGPVTTVIPDTNVPGDIQRYNFTTSGTATIAAPGSIPGTGLSRVLTLIQHNASGGTVALAWNAIYQGGMTASLLSGQTNVSEFVYDPGEAKFVQIGELQF